LDNKGVVITNLSFKLFGQWDKDVVDVMGSLSNVGLSGSNSTGDGSGQDVVVVGLKSPLLHFHVSLELKVGKEISESSFKFFKWSSKFNLKFDEFGCNLAPAGLLELLNLVL
jgi:hypothetical protein